MNSKKTNIIEYLKQKNVKRFSLFFAIAFVFLIFSKLSNDYKQNIKLKISLVNVDDEVILQNDSLNTIMAFIEAKGFALVPYLFKDYKTIVIDAKTDDLRLSYSKRATKVIPIVLNKAINFAIGYDVKGNYKLDI